MSRLDRTRSTSDSPLEAHREGDATTQRANADPSKLLILSEKDVDDVIRSLAPGEILACVGRALHAYSHATAAPKSAEDKEPPAIQNPLRISVLTPNHTVLFMPSRLGSQATTSIKIVSVPRSSDAKTGLPATTLLMDERTGQTQVVMNARNLTAVRTAAASALALSLAPTSRSAQRLLIFGTGLQALWHAHLVASISNEICEIVIACREANERAIALKEDLRHQYESKGIDIQLTSIENAIQSGGILENADLVCCCTPSGDNLFSVARLKRGASLSLIGSYKPHMREVDLAPLFEAGRDPSSAQRIIVDSTEACIEEAGELYQLKKDCPDMFSNDEALRRRLVELGDLVNAEGDPVKGALADGETCVFKCVGLGVMDSAISALIVNKALEMQAGSRVKF